jgi:hypothetical protein
MLATNSPQRAASYWINSPQATIAILHGENTSNFF